jgi:cell division septum initiation protein DivIVA
MVNDLELLAAKVETVIDDLKAAQNRNKELLKENKRLEERIASLDKEKAKSQKEGEKIAELVAQNKEYRKKCNLVKSKIASMLAKVEGLQ